MYYFLIWKYVGRFYLGGFQGEGVRKEEVGKW